MTIDYETQETVAPKVFSTIKRQSPQNALQRKKKRKATKYRVKGIEGVSPLLTIKGAKQKAWKAFAAFIRNRDPNCVTCGARTTEAGHYLHNSDKTNQQLGGNELWYNEKNVAGQCGTCNRWHSGKAAHFSFYLINKYGDGIIQELHRKFRTEKKWTIPEILSIEAKYKDL